MEEQNEEQFLESIEDAERAMKLTAYNFNQCEGDDAAAIGSIFAARQISMEYYIYSEGLWEDYQEWLTKNGGCQSLFDIAIAAFSPDAEDEKFQKLRKEIEEVMDGPEK